MQVAERWQDWENLNDRLSLKFAKTLPNENSVTTAELAAAEKSAYAVISLVKFGHLTFDLEGPAHVSPERDGQTKPGRCAASSERATASGSSRR